MASADELRRRREDESAFAFLYDMARQHDEQLAAEGRRPVFGGLLSKEPVAGVDTVRYEGMGNMLAGLLSPVARAVDAPISAYRGTIPQEDMINEAMNVTGMAMAGGGAIASPQGALASNALRSAKPNDGIVMAQRILDMRAAGRASEVTDEMMAQADPQYMFDNTPLPMDEAARMARAEAAGFGGDLYHGGKADYSTIRTDAGTGKTYDTGAFLTSSKKLAETYSPHVEGGVYPLKSKSSAPMVGADMQNWNNIESPVYAFDPKAMDDIEVIDEYGRASTDDIAREAKKMFEAIEIQDVSDRGPRSWGMTDYPSTSDIRVEYDPANIRSRFARFDPEFAHLANLNAANASPVGGLLAQSGVSDKQAEKIETYLKKVGLLQ